MENRRNLIVIEHRMSGEQFLWNPFKNSKVVPTGFFAITREIPLNEIRYGDLPEIEELEGKE